MCPFCRDLPKPCAVIEQPSGKLVCECGRHSWPNAGVYAESVRRENLTTVRTVHTWTQGF